VGKAGLKRLGRKKWRRHVYDVAALLKRALEVDDVVLGGGNAKLVRALPRGVRRGANQNAFVGGARLWNEGPGSPFCPHGTAR
jgi:polyphosphate glucokinase